MENEKTPDSDAMAEVILNQIALTDPAMATMLRQMYAASDRSDDPPSDDPELDDSESQIGQLIDELERVERELEQMRGELTNHGSPSALSSTEKAVLNELTGALGMCRECLGQRDDCPACVGKGGQPLRERIDEAAWHRWIAPAVKQRGRI